MELRLISSSTTTSSLSFLLLFLLVSLCHLSLSHAQQTYINNKQLDCYNFNNASFTNGYDCNGPRTSCDSYLVFRSHPPYNSPVEIGYLLNSEPLKIATINNISDVDQIPMDTQIIVPVNCSCSGKFYQHNSSYTLKDATETYFTVSNNTFQGLTTCQALINQNPYDSRELYPQLKLSVPVRCACPTINQTANGVNFLLTYLITWGDSIDSIAETFGVDPQSIQEANELSWDSIIFPFTPILIPLKTEPTKIGTASGPSPSQPQSPQPSIVPVGRSKSSKKWVFVGIGIGAALFLLALSGFLVWFLFLRSKPVKSTPEGKKLVGETVQDYIPQKKPGPVSSQDVGYIIESLTVYKFEDLQRATGFFSEDHRIKGSVYHGVLKGDNAAIKRMEGNASNEINILKQINHANVIRLSGFCAHDGDTYLVYEFSENGSLSDWLHDNKYQTSSSSFLGWKQRVQIAYDVADGLNYLHNYINPPYIHKDLKSSNILLDGNFRAKIANFGLARTVENEEEEEGQGGLQMTRHVVGTQGYMAPEYLENGLVTAKLDVFAFGVVMLELLSGREASSSISANSNNDEEEKGGGGHLLSASIKRVLEGENVRGKLREFIDPCLMEDYPLDLAFSMAQLANECVLHDMNSRPTMPQVFLSLSMILSSSLDWDASYDLEEHSSSRSLSHAR